MIQNTHESIHGAVGKRPVFHRFVSQSPRLWKYGEQSSKRYYVRMSAQKSGSNQGSIQQTSLYTMPSHHDARRTGK